MDELHIDMTFATLGAPYREWTTVCWKTRMTAHTVRYWRLNEKVDHVHVVFDFITHKDVANDAHASKLLEILARYNLLFQLKIYNRQPTLTGPCSSHADEQTFWSLRCQSTWHCH